MPRSYACGDCVRLHYHEAVVAEAGSPQLLASGVAGGVFTYSIWVDCCSILDYLSGVALGASRRRKSEAGVALMEGGR